MWHAHHAYKGRSICTAHGCSPTQQASCLLLRVIAPDCSPACRTHPDAVVAHHNLLARLQQVGNGLRVRPHSMLLSRPCKQPGKRVPPRHMNSFARGEKQAFAASNPQPACCLTISMPLWPVPLATRVYLRGK